MKQLLLAPTRGDIAQKHPASRFIFTTDHRGEWDRMMMETEMADVAFTCPSEMREQTVERNHRRSRRGIMTQECILTGRITRLAIFKVPEFGTRASFHLQCAGRSPTVCAVDGNVAREFIAHYCEGEMVVVSGFHEARPSTAAANTPWAGRFRVRDIRVAADIRLAA